MKQNTPFLCNPDEIVEKYADMVYRLAFSEVKNKEDAEDIFQEVFVRLVKYRDTIQSEEHVKAWLLRVTINCAKKHFSSYWNRNVYGFDDNQKDEPATQTVPDRDEECERVYQAVMELAPKYRRTIHLFYYEELSIQEIAVLLKEKESTVKSQLFRARSMVKEKLEGKNK